MTRLGLDKGVSHQFLHIWFQNVMFTFGTIKI